MRPLRNECRKRIEPGGISIGIGADVRPLGSRAIDLCHHFRHASPIFFAGDLDVPDFDRNVRLASDPECLINGREHGIALVAHVGRINAAELRSLACQCD